MSQAFFWLQFCKVRTRQQAFKDGKVIQVTLQMVKARPLVEVFCCLVTNICFSLDPSLTESVLSKTPPATRTQFGPPWTSLAFPAFCMLPLALDFILRITDFVRLVCSLAYIYMDSNKVSNTVPMFVQDKQMIQLQTDASYRFDKMIDDFVTRP